MFFNFFFIVNIKITVAQGLWPVGEGSIPTLYFIYN